MNQAKINQGTTVLLGYAIDIAFKFKVLFALVRRLSHADATQCYICAPYTTQHSIPTLTSLAATTLNI